MADDEMINDAPAPRRGMPPREAEPTTEPESGDTAGDEDVVEEVVEEREAPAVEEAAVDEPVAAKGASATRPAATEPPARARRKVSAVSIVGLLLLALGLGSLAYMGWEYWGTNVTSGREATKAKETLKQKWEQERKSPRPTSLETGADGVVRAKKPIEGEWIALVRIPKLGDDYEWPIIAGVTDEVLTKGIGWYTETSTPGQIGNFAIAGHRITHGEPFARMLELDKGDKVIVETRDFVYTYELYTAPRDLTVKNTDVWVIDPVPGKKGEKPTEALITLTTCTNLFATPDRSVAFGRLLDKKPA